MGKKIVLFSSFSSWISFTGSFPTLPNVKYQPHANIYSNDSSNTGCSKAFLIKPLNNYYHIHHILISDKADGTTPIHQRLLLSDTQAELSSRMQLFSKTNFLELFFLKLNFNALHFAGIYLSKLKRLYKAKSETSPSQWSFTMPECSGHWGLVPC